MTTERKWTFTDHKDEVLSVAFGSDGKTLASSSRRGKNDASASGI